MKWIARISLIILMSLTNSLYAQSGENPFGQIIQINTHFRGFIGKPIWMLEIRDVDHNQNIPYIFDIRRGSNYWTVFTYGRNYMISASNLQIETYQARYNKYKNYRMKNFCNLESNGRILRGESMTITIDGVLSPYSNTYNCSVAIYPDDNYFIYKSE